MISECTVKRFVREGEMEKIENYDKAIADKTQTWHCHHRLELTLDGEFAHTRDEMKRLGMYYNRPYFELIFLSHAEHRRLHGKTRSEESRKKTSKSLTGKKASEEKKRKLSKIFKGKKLSEERRKKLSTPRSNSDFGKKYFAHFGYSRKENEKQYQREKSWYYFHKKCRWEP